MCLGTVSKALLISIAVISVLRAGLAWLSPSSVVCVMFVSNDVVEDIMEMILDQVVRDRGGRSPLDRAVNGSMDIREKVREKVKVGVAVGGELVVNVGRKWPCKMSNLKRRVNENSPFQFFLINNVLVRERLQITVSSSLFIGL